MGTAMTSGRRGQKAKGQAAEATGGPARAQLKRKALRIAAILDDSYGSPRHGNKDDPLDELVFILLSQMTTGPSFNRVYDRLKAAYPAWKNLLEVPHRQLKTLIKDAGLSGQKAPRLQAVFQKLKQDFGAVTLQPLAQMTNEDAETYLTALPGIGLKSAKCILMYSLGRHVLPVDTHVWRVTRRLGLVDERVPYTKVHQALEAVTPARARYGLHVNGLAHGRQVCLTLRPRCGICPLRRMCAFRAKARS